MAEHYIVFTTAQKFEIVQVPSLDSLLYFCFLELLNNFEHGGFLE